MAEKKFTPKIVGFLCRWCSYTGADLAGISRARIPSSIKVIRVMCTGRINPLFIIKAYLQGADGVLVSGCHPEECHYQKGNYYARRRFAALRKIFETLGLPQERLKLSWISASEAPKYQEVTSRFHKEIEKLGENPTRTEMFI
ncbi:MAG: hydrogenase iron-sulfur subunit [Candidatus Eremiobacteraeota bacterium]|nr:hydrogenase iron-sulfur subunit [Candidatus Eremiobacteraeota bacterium]